MMTAAQILSTFVSGLTVLTLVYSTGKMHGEKTAHADKLAESLANSQLERRYETMYYDLKKRIEFNTLRFASMRLEIQSLNRAVRARNRRVKILRGQLEGRKLAMLISGEPIRPGDLTIAETLPSAAGHAVTLGVANSIPEIRAESFR